MAVNGTAQLFGFDFIISAIEKLYPNMEILSLDSYTRDSSYLPENQEAYLRYFLSIAKRIISEGKNK